MQKIFIIVSLCFFCVVAGGCVDKSSSVKRTTPLMDTSYPVGYYGMSTGQAMMVKDGSQTVEVILGQPYVSGLGEACFEAKVSNVYSKVRAFCREKDQWVLFPEIVTSVQ